MQTWLHWRCQDALLVQKHFVALFHPKPNECLRFDLESCNLMCTYTFVTHPSHIPPLAQARPMMLCIYTSLPNSGLRYYTDILTQICVKVRMCKMGLQKSGRLLATAMSYYWPVHRLYNSYHVRAIQSMACVPFPTFRNTPSSRWQRHY